MTRTSCLIKQLIVMKRTYLIILTLLSTTIVLGQVPQKLSYQAVVRDEGNILVANRTIGLRITILQGSVDGTAVYTETQTPVTNANGLVTIEIGGGEGFGTLDWSAGPYFLKTETDPAGGTDYTISGTSQLLSVPFALHAQTAVVAKSVAGSIAENLQPPAAVSLPATGITTTSATLNGVVNGQGFSTSVVFEWGTSTAYGNSVTSTQSPVTGAADVAVSASITALSMATDYHYRIKATNPVNVTYSQDQTFTTQMVTTAPITSITPVSAVCGGTVVHDGGSPVTARGVCWSKNPDPTLADGFTIDGDGIGDFISTITGLDNSTLYYVRAYATNGSGTFFGSSRTFRTFHGTVSDFDGNIYGTVIIGTQEWMAENLKTTHYRNGTAVENVSDKTAWENTTTGAYAWYDNNASWKDIYGALYNWYAATSEDGLCPAGWHLPTSAEWTTLTDFAGGTSVAGGKLKSTSQTPDPHPRWYTPNAGATNEFGFYGHPGGSRNYYGDFTSIGGGALFWSTGQFATGFSYFLMLQQSSASVNYTWVSQKTGLSIRCIKDQ
jgi:uncharacterized protein (TIGR02145 family)